MVISENSFRGRRGAAGQGVTDGVRSVVPGQGHPGQGHLATTSLRPP